MDMQVQTALGAIVRAPQARELPCGVFGSFGWSGEAVDELENRLKVRGSCSQGQTGCLFTLSAIVWRCKTHTACFWRPVTVTAFAVIGMLLNICLTMAFGTKELNVYLDL